MLRIMHDADADIMCFGNTHKPYHRIIAETAETGARYRHAINIGSVGKPKDNDIRGGYVLLTLDERSSVQDRESVQVEFIRFDYDVEKAAKAVEDSPLPNDYAENLRRGY